MEKRNPSTLPELPDRLHSMAIRLLRRLRTEDDRAGLSAPRLSALSVLVFRGAMTLGDLAAAEQIRPPSMTRLVRELEAAGLVTIEAHPEDRRSILVRATDAGVSLVQEGRSRRVSRLQELLEPLPERDRATLVRAVGILERILR